jgi:uncharacterized protein with ParB-like and HNH nuclease domain
MSDSQNLKNIQQLLDYTFTIEGYQRGYRWDVTQVLSILEDIDEYSRKDHAEEPFYCLQPLVVKQDEINNNTYELIDGQQRTTTIHLVLMHLNSKNFDINYTTRNTNDRGENTFIKSLKTLKIPDLEVSNDIDDHSPINNIISKAWKKITENNDDDVDTVDNFYLFRAYCVIVNWFKIEERKTFESTLLNKTKFIWYEESKESSNNKIIKKFINFNEGKIELEQAELIKALFVLDILRLPSPIQRQYEENKFADDWNLIEHQLSDPKFWQFISNNKNDETVVNKINLVFQLYNGFGRNEDKYYNYRKLENKFSISDLTNEEKPQWETITNLYNSLEEWYFDRTTYHLCGAIIHLTNNNISAILTEAKESLTKQEFRNKLRKKLKDYFFNEDAWKDKYDPDKITYNNSNEVTKVLFLFNIALTQITEKDSFFPFHRFYNVKSWNIEHILAKNDDGLKEMEEFKSFSKIAKELIKNAENETENQNISQENLNAIGELIQELNNFIRVEKLPQCKQKVKEINDKLFEIFQIDDFNNLCLLDQSTNIKVGKRPFKEKRDITLKLHEKIKLESIAYLPIGTRLVFSKQATPSKDYQSNYWSFKDRTHYLDKVKETIREFLIIEKNGN